MKALFPIVAALFGTMNAVGQGHLLWNEAVNGPLGVHAGVPTGLGLLSMGTNFLLGSAEVERTGGNSFVHEDYFRFLIPSGTRISQAYLTVDNQHLGLWIGSDDFNTQIGYAPNTINGGLLSQLGIQSLSAGGYGMYLGNYDFAPPVSVANYRLDFVLTAVPEPSTWALLGLGGALLWSATRRRRK